MNLREHLNLFLGNKGETPIFSREQGNMHPPPPPWEALLPVYQNTHCVNSVCEKAYSIFRCLFYFQCSTDLYKYKGKCLFRRIPHASHSSFNPLAISNKQATIINGNIPVALRYVFPAHTSEPLRTIDICFC